MSPTPTPTPGYDPLDSIPSGTERVIHADPLDDIPTTVSQVPIDIVNYSASGDDGESSTLAARCPLSWSAIIDEIRQDPTMPFMSVFKSRSDFVRWSIWRGINAAQQFRVQMQEADGEELDPIVSAHIFAERTLGMLNARTSLITTAKRQVSKLAEAVEIVVNAGEVAEACKLIEHYMMGVKAQTDPFWRAFFTRQLLDNELMRTHVIQFLSTNELTDAYLLQYAINLGFIETPLEIDTQEVLYTYPELAE